MIKLGTAVGQLFVRLLIGGMFIYAGSQKLFAGIPENSATRTVYDELVQAHSSLHYLLVVAELTIGVLFAAGYWHRVTAGLAVVVLSLFAGFLTAELTKERPKACGCFGISTALSDVIAIRKELLFALTRDGALLLGAAWLFVSGEGKQSTGSAGGTNTEEAIAPESRLKGEPA